ncbi:hypothetical protein HNP84_009637 [Thermocatellispora tengchongensis]|uniref:Uncharacterized protein n=2 Tax=Thermocatellispora tengchongensis TaxID=1073253 RepID=A0A840PP94_9ACTN|nr:hypothetical protein [Thermocatellispora tengchongensis]MBB5139873.1 hypothetical protein [Thermocatellispora tengchongensis]
MARLLRGIDDELYVQYGHFTLGGTDLSRFTSPEGYHFTAAVRMEAWDAEPARPDGSWEPVEESTFVADSGVVHLVAMMDERGHDFLIGPPYFEYGVTAHVQVDGEGGVGGEDAADERWLLRFWPIRDAFDPLKHMRAMERIIRMPEEYVPLPLPPELRAPPLEPRRVPVPVSTAQEWAAMRPGAFDDQLRRTQARLARQGVTVHDWLREQGVDVADDTPITAELIADLQKRPGRFRDRYIDRYYGRAVQREALPHGFEGWEPHVQEERLRELADGELIAEALNPRRVPEFSMPYQQRGVERLYPGTSRRLWRWEDEIIDGEPFDGNLLVDRTVHARDPYTRQIYVSGIVTILRADRRNRRMNWYVVRDAEPHEAARVRCSEATWQEEEPGR